VSPIDWCGTTEACQLLKISRSSLYRLRLQRVLLPGAHFYRSGISGGGGILWNVPACRLALRTACWG
jgi:hypothetical protein